MLTIKNFDKLIAQKGLTLVTPKRRWTIDNTLEGEDAYVVSVIEQNNPWNDIIFTLERRDSEGRYALKNNRDLQYKFLTKESFENVGDFISELRNEAWRFN
jgi:hypothetical protein